MTLTYNVKQKVANEELRRLDVLTEDLREFFNSEEDALLLDNIFKNAKRYTGLFYEAADRLLPQRQYLGAEDEVSPASLQLVIDMIGRGEDRGLPCNSA